MTGLVQKFLDLEAEAQLPDMRLRVEHRSRRLATALISEKGELNQKVLDSLITFLEATPFIHYPGREADSLLGPHHLKVLVKLRNDPSFYKAIKKIGRPLCHKGAEELIRETLGLKGSITDVDIHRAILSACLSLLRQQVGSCFATAPAILIHEEQVACFVADIGELLTTGKLKRTFSGVEHTVPLGPNSGYSLLKAWEYTLASFSEIKMEFSRWNLYASLGFRIEEEGGIGEILYHYIDTKLQQSNEHTLRYQEEYQIAFNQVRAAEALLKQAGSEAEVRRLQAEYQSRVYHMRSCLELRDRHHHAASRYASFFSLLVEQYSIKFQEFFQEIYDAKMHELQGALYEDSPAGFRLVYKHGRRDAASWTFIYDEKEWIQALTNFFLSVESSIASLCDWDSAEKEMTEITATIIAHLRTRRFLQTAYLRSAKLHDPGATPWAYHSGGSMEILLKTYFRRENPITEEARWVESSVDLLIFILEVLKNLPPSITNPFLEDPDKGMLISSPTHAFILRPGWSFLKEGWQDAGFTYTWVRDRLIVPMCDFYAKQSLSPSMQQYLIDAFGAKISAFSRTVTLAEFRKHLAGDQVDAFLYSMIPLTPSSEWKATVRELLEGIVDVDHLPDPGGPWIGSLQLQESAKLIALKAQKAWPIDLHAAIAKKARALGKAPPSPLLFADTNWANSYFAFAVAPGTDQLKLWRMDLAGTLGTPMNSWEPWMNGSNKASWTIYTHTYQYKK